MRYRKFGNTTLLVSEVGFGAWAIGGPAQVGGMPIGWGKSDDSVSILAIREALEVGINFFDTADFYGLGHSEELLGRELRSEKDTIIATKVGQKKSTDNRILVDYSEAYIISACEASLKRLRRDHIDYYQLHTAKLPDLEKGACITALEKLIEQGKIRYWGVSLSTFTPELEGNYLLEKRLGQGLQLVLNLINQKALPLIERAGMAECGVIARMPLQFGLLTGKFDEGTKFEANDHRSFRLPANLITRSEELLKPVWSLLETYETNRVGISLGFILSHPAVSTVIPGMKTREQVRQNVESVVQISDADRIFIEQLFHDQLQSLLSLFETTG